MHRFMYQQRMHLQPFLAFGAAKRNDANQSAVAFYKVVSTGMSHTI